MEPSELAFYTAKELIQELMRRKTFLGVVLHSEQDYKNGKWQGERVFKLHHNDNLKPEEAGRLLDTVADYLARK